MSPLLRKSLRNQTRSFAAWGIGLAALVAMYAAFYPSVRDSAAALQGYLQHMPDAVKNLIGGDFTTPAGYLRSETFSTLGPILFLVFAIGAGARAIAGEEEARTLDLLLSTPIRRRQVLFDKAVAIVVATLGLSTVIGVTIALVGPPFGLRVPLSALAAECVMLFLLGVAFGSIALAVGCYTGRRGLAAGVTGALATVTYVLNVVAPSVSGIEALRPVSPFRWYLEPDALVSGLSIESALVLVGIAVVAYLGAAVAFERRDLRA